MAAQTSALKTEPVLPRIRHDSWPSERWLEPPCFGITKHHHGEADYGRLKATVGSSFDEFPFRLTVDEILLSYRHCRRRSKWLKR